MIQVSIDTCSTEASKGCEDWGDIFKFVGTTCIQRDPVSRTQLDSRQVGTVGIVCGISKLSDACIRRDPVSRAQLDSRAAEIKVMNAPVLSSTKTYEH